MSFCIITESFLLRKSTAEITCTNTGSQVTAYLPYTVGNINVYQFSYHL